MAFNDYYRRMTPDQKQRLAEKMGITVYTVRAYAYGNRPPTLDFAAKVCKADPKFDPNILMDTPEFVEQYKTAELVKQRMEKKA